MRMTTMARLKSGERGGEERMERMGQFGTDRTNTALSYLRRRTGNNDILRNTCTRVRLLGDTNTGLRNCTNKALTFNGAF